jgi:hypothetical protein
MTTLLVDTARDLATRLGNELKLRRGEKVFQLKLRELVEASDALIGIILTCCAGLRETLEREGCEGRRLAKYSKGLLEVTDSALAEGDETLGLANNVGVDSTEAGLPQLSSKLAALRESRPYLADVVAMATRPPRPIDEARMAESDAALERGEFVNVDDEYLRRLHAGEDY